MIICICNRINSRGVEVAIEAGATSPEDVQSHHGCEFNCGSCQCTIGELIATAHEGTEKSELLVAAK